MGLEIQENVSLGPLTTFGIGGPARYFTSVANSEEAGQALDVAKQSGLPIAVIGGGSNIVVSDEGFPGLVISNGIHGFDVQHRGDRTMVTVGAGERWDETVRWAVANGWAGIECLSGIPGSVGAAPIQNIGAYGQSVAEVLTEVHAVDRDTQESLRLTSAACAFEYRGSIFQKAVARYLITRVTLALTPGGSPTITHPDVRGYLVAHRDTPTLAAVRQAVLDIRSRKGYVILPGYERYLSAGSFFKNPVVAVDAFQRIREVTLALRGEDGSRRPWFWELAGGAVKLSAAHLIELAGFPKGYRMGQVGISPRHALALVNFGTGTARELIALAKAIQARVAGTFEVALEPEVQFVGFPCRPL